MFDATEPLTDEDQAYLDRFANRQRLIIANKIDQPNANAIEVDCLQTSATEGTGIEALKDASAPQCGVVKSARTCCRP